MGSSPCALPLLEQPAKNISTSCKEWECVLELSEIGTSVLVVVLAQVQALLKLLPFWFHMHSCNRNVFVLGIYQRCSWGLPHSCIWKQVSILFLKQLFEYYIISVLCFCWGLFCFAFKRKQFSLDIVPEVQAFYSVQLPWTAFLNLYQNSVHQLHGPVHSLVSLVMPIDVTAKFN